MKQEGRLFRLGRWLGEFRCYLGRDPERVSGPALIFFPLQRTTFCCGLAGILVLRRRNPEPAGQGLEELFAQARRQDLSLLLAGRFSPSDYLGGASLQERMEKELLRLKGEEAFQVLFFSPTAAERLAKLSQTMHDWLAAEERLLEAPAGCFSTTVLETINRGLVMIRDLIWGLDRDLLENIRRIRALAGAENAAEVAPEALSKYRKLNFLLNSLDRLEVRGRDSAGVEIVFATADASSLSELIARLPDDLREELERRRGAADLINGSVRCVLMEQSRGGTVSFTYKTASIIGSLGKNVQELRKAIATDRLFQTLAALPVACEAAFAHTRWASVGSITEENCHPLSNFTSSGADHAAKQERVYPAYGKGPWFVDCVLNGDIDNYVALRKSLADQGEGWIAPEVTTDTKIIPLQIEKYLLDGYDLANAFRRACADFEGSQAIAMLSNLEPGKLFLALKGSGQSIYVGLAPDRYLCSSELYGLIEETPYFLKMDGEMPSFPGKPETAGQILILDEASVAGVVGIRGLCYDGSPLTLGAKDVQRAEITTRDIDRGDYPHYFLKEITEAVLSVKKTLRGKYRIEREENRERVVFNLGDDIVPERIRQALREGRIRRVIIIGHGTAAVAGSVVAEGMASRLAGSGIQIEDRIASEFSGFCLEKDLHDTLVIPVTQSGTTTDTNRAVAMAAERGAAVIAIVNRRQSDLTAKADGVFYTSDGRDIEMAVASTKAFYSQIVAGRVLTIYLAELLGTLSPERIAVELRRLDQLPVLMERLLARREEIRRAAETLAKQRRYWAVVGSGPNRAASDEIRIKLSELCYKTISSDVIENKKHIDLSAEPLILVCAAGNPEAVTGDVVKDTAIFKAHRSCVVVFADEAERRFDAIADAVIQIPRALMPLPVILNTLAGHLFGYYAACSIDEEAIFFREFQGHLSLIMVEQARRHLNPYEAVADGKLRRLVNEFAERFTQRRNEGGFLLMEAKTLADLTLLLKYAALKLPLNDFRRDFPTADGALSPLELLDATLSRAVDELARPIDAIRHQAKTVTVGTSRKEEPLTGLLFELLAKLNFSAGALLGTNILALARIQRSVAAIQGYTLYAVNHLDSEGQPQEDSTLAIVDRGGISLGKSSRTEVTGRLMGTKRGIVASDHVYVGQGKSDGASIVIVPLLDQDERIHRLLLIHVDFNESLTVAERKEVLGGRTGEIRNLIEEVNLAWDDRYLAEIPLEVLLGEPIEVIVGKIREGGSRPAEDGRHGDNGGV
ncbi:MAG: SIS domain-containing protein [Syntrophaceae bacterium]|nr:SIS domain-containing protein [Syntrophaceae bacterium]